MSDEDMNFDDVVIDNDNLVDDESPATLNAGTDCRRKIEERLDQMRAQRLVADYDFD